MTWVNGRNIQELIEAATRAAQQRMDPDWGLPKARFELDPSARVIDFDVRDDPAYAAEQARIRDLHVQALSRQWSRCQSLW